LISIFELTEKRDKQTATGENNRLGGGKYTGSLMQVKCHTHQVVEDVLLMDVYGDERLVLGPLGARQFLRRDLDELVEDVEKHVARHRHDLLVGSRQLQGDLAVARPDHLQPE